MIEKFLMIVSWGGLVVGSTMFIGRCIGTIQYEGSLLQLEERIKGRKRNFHIGLWFSVTFVPISYLYVYYHQ